MGLKKEHELGKKYHIVAFATHAGDMEGVAGGVIAKHVKVGHKATIVNFMLGEKAPFATAAGLSAEEYAEEKRKESEEAARVLGANVRFLPFKDAELPDTDDARYLICDLIRELKPDIIICPGPKDVQKDHIITYRIVKDAIFWASLPGMKRKYPAHSIKNLYFAEGLATKNFSPNVYIDITDVFDIWVESLMKFRYIRDEKFGGFPRLDYYKTLARLRGIESGFKYAQAFETDLILKLQFFPINE